MHDARWSPDGYRIAYLAGSVLHVVAGDATGDHAIAAAVTPVAPAWQPDADHVLTFAGRQGEIRTYAADETRLLWRARPAQPPHSLSWSADGRTLLAVGRSSLTLYQADGSPAGEILGPGAAPVVTAALAPDGRRLAVVQRTRLGSVLWLYPSLRPDATATRRLFAAPASSPTSPGRRTDAGCCSPGKARPVAVHSHRTTAEAGRRLRHHPAVQPRRPPPRRLPDRRRLVLHDRR